MPTIVATCGSHGTIDPIGDVSVTLGGNRAFTITPDAGYAEAWMMIDGLVQWVAPRQTATTCINVITDRTFHVEFLPIPLTYRASSPLLELLSRATTDPLQMTDLYVITLQNETVLYWTSLDVDVPSVTIASPPAFAEVSDQTFTSVLIKRGALQMARGLACDEMSLTLYPRPEDMVGADTFLQAVVKGLLDGARVELFRAFFQPDWAYIVGTVMRFAGRVSAITNVSRTSVEMTVRSNLELLDMQMPPHVYQPTCRLTLYEWPCSAEKIGNEGLVEAGSTQLVINTDIDEFWSVRELVGGEEVGTGDGTTRSFQIATADVVIFSTPIIYLDEVQLGMDEYTINSVNVVTLAVAPGAGVAITADYLLITSGYFDNGLLEFVDGPNAGVIRTIVNSGEGVFKLAHPLPFVPVTGNAVLAYQGCDKTMAQCVQRFNNLARFSGEPFIPPADYAF